MYNDPASVRVELHITPTQRRDLERIANEDRVSLSTIIRNAIDRYVSDSVDDLRDDGPHQ